MENKHGTQIYKGNVGVASHPFPGPPHLDQTPATAFILYIEYGASQ